MSDLTTRFRFIERYGVDPKKPLPGEITSYEVGSRDVIKVSVDKPQGTPDRKETTVQIVYTERPAVVNTSDVVTDTVRRYNTLRVSPAPASEATGRKPLEGLTVWFKNRPTGPLLLSLTEGRPLAEAEYAATLRQIYLPDLAGVLPPTPRRVGDRWSLPRAASQALLGERPARARRWSRPFRTSGPTPKGSTASR